MTPNPALVERRRLLATTLGAAALVATPFRALAQSPDYPSKPIRIVVPFPPGGYSDALARVIGKSISLTFGQSVVVENRPGAGGNIGADIVAKSAPDGYNLVMGTIGTQAVNPLIFPKIPYDVAKDFAPVAFVADAETVLVVHPSVPARTVDQLVALAKRKPGDLTFASGGSGTTGHLAGELFKSSTSTFMTHIPYKGNVPALTDLVAGQVSLSFATLSPALAFIKDSRLIAIATAGAKRANALPNTPTLREQGLRDFEVRNWTGLLAPAGTPPQVTTRLAAEVDKIMHSAEVLSMLAAQGLSYTRMGPDEFDRFIRSESRKWAAVVQKAGIKAD